jgi:hypothetical protein
MKWANVIETKAGRTLRVPFKNGEHLDLAYSLSEQLTVVSSTGKVDYTHGDDGALFLAPQPVKPKQ